MADISKLKFTRGLIKSKVTRFQNYLASLDTQDLDNNTISQLKLRATNFKNVLDEFNKVQDEIEFALESEEPQERNNFETIYYELNSKSDEIISLFRGNNETAIQVNNVTSGGNNLQNQQLKLPIINLPTFDGNSNQWFEFRDAFSSLIHNNQSIATVQKFYYLRSSLKGEAEQVVHSIKISEANYAIAWDLLHERYENKRLVVHNHVRAMFDFPPLKRENRADLRNLYDIIIQNLRALKTLGQPTDTWDTLIVYLLTSKFDNTTMREWESWNLEGDLPTVNDITKFLKKRCEILEKLETRSEARYDNHKLNKGQIKAKGYSNSYASTNFNCYFCEKAHTIFTCQAFLKLPIHSRIQEIKRLQLCINCLKPSHTAQTCILNSNCRKCGKRHNTLLHLEKGNTATNQSASDTQTEQKKEENTQEVAIVGHSSDNTRHSQVLLSTALISVEDKHGQIYTCRALLDSGSQSNFVTSAFCKRLGLQTKPINFTISGVGQAMSDVKEQATIKISSRNNSYNKTITALILSKITDDLPLVSFSSKQLQIPGHLKLADPTFNTTGSIDMLLGSNVFWNVLCVGQIQLSPNMPMLHKTLFGWVIGGDLKYNQLQVNKSISCLNIKLNNLQLDEQLTKFWQLEQCDNKTILSDDDKYCESHFLNNTERDREGRFIVRIPLKPNRQNLGESRQAALDRFLSIEKRLIKNDKLREEYVKFMQEYESLGHMSHVSETHDNKTNYYLPHHAIIREQSSTTKIRVVFDASMKTDSGVSLNDIQYSGPTIQSNLLSIILRFRMHEYVMTADISKMYRQVLINPDQRNLQRILWRADSNKEIQCYELNTVTYGTASAPFLAVRCLNQIADEYKTIFPRASETIKYDFYVDDLLTGTSSKSDLVKLQGEISTILKSAGFELRKWLCNKPELVDQFQINRDLAVNIVELGENQQNKTLGIYWNAKLDTIQYSITQCNQSNITKRSILSITSQIYDPLGLLGPIIIIAKILMQQLWLAKVSWDETIPQVLHLQWRQFLNDLPNLNSIKIPIFILVNDYEKIEMHAFCDASERAYGACVYIKCKTKLGNYSSNLLCAKSRVAPIKQVSLPRLELCSAVLLVQLVESVKSSLNIKFDKFYYYSDSTIALCWIKSQPNKWKTFVANRTSEIQQSTKFDDWYHVRSNENPADLISRGVDSDTLLNSGLWWKGPKFLLQDDVNFNSDIPILESNNLPEQRTSVNTITNIDNFNIFDKFSSWVKLQRVTAYCCRFINNLKCKSNERSLGNLSISELQNATNILIKICQMQEFKNDYKNLSNNKPIDKHSKILSLNPYLHKNIIRVGGRIRNSDFNFDKKFPIILPQRHNLTKLLMRHEHNQLFHCGPSMLLSSFREKYWPISGRNLAEDIVRKCVVCFRTKPSSIQYLMGDLPASRLKQTVPFLNCGVDYAGPFLVKDRRGRGSKLSKAYVCLYICLATKAIHIDLVSDLSTDSFLACLKRFIARRGKPITILSDNGKNFIGANSKLQELHTFFRQNGDKIINSMSIDNIEWKFIPPRSPNFGGIYEAGIKSMKFHMKRVMGNAHLTYEEFTTVLTQIESILNSRPLCPLTTNPDDPSPLTPAHFLVGRSLISIPERDLKEVPEGRLNRYERLQQLLQHFWSRWNREYIAELQTRVKWRQHSATLLKIGSLVIVKQENTAPLKWSLGRVVQLHPGADGVVRVVSLRLNDNVVKRAVNKLCLLPISDHD